jgi:hypothetical protein
MKRTSLMRAAWSALPVAVLVAATEAPAGPIVLFDFEDAGGAVMMSNYYAQGFRFSPNTHRDGFAGPTGVWLGWDGYADPPPSPLFATANRDWLGPAALSPYTNGGSRVDSAWMFIDAPGRTFSLIALDVVQYGLEFRSSSGGVRYVEALSGAPTTYSFIGAGWTELDWLLVRAFSPGVPAGFDNLIVHAVAEPVTLSLVGLGLAGWLAMRGRAPRREALASPSSSAGHG